MKEILKIRCHVSISMKKVIILRSIHAKNEVFRSTSLHHRKKLNIPLTCRFITYSIRIGNLDCCKFQKQPLKIFCEKRSSLKFRKVCTKRLWQRKHLWILRNVKEHFFLQNNSGRLFLKCGHCKNEAREIDCLCCRKVDTIYIVSAKIQEREESISLSTISHTY